MPITAESNFIDTGLQDAESSDIEVPLEAIIDRALGEQRERRSYWDVRSHSKVLDANQHGEYDDKNAKEGTMARMQMLITQGSIENHSFFFTAVVLRTEFNVPHFKIGSSAMCDV